MKKIFCLFTLMLSFIFLVGCKDKPSNRNEIDVDIYELPSVDVKVLKGENVINFNILEYSFINEVEVVCNIEGSSHVIDSDFDDTDVIYVNKTYSIKVMVTSDSDVIRLNYKTDNFTLDRIRTSESKIKNTITIKKIPSGKTKIYCYYDPYCAPGIPVINDFDCLYKLSTSYRDISFITRYASGNVYFKTRECEEVILFNSGEEKTYFNLYFEPDYEEVNTYNSSYYEFSVKGYKGINIKESGWYKLSSPFDYEINYDSELYCTKAVDNTRYIYVDYSRRETDSYYVNGNRIDYYGENSYDNCIILEGDVQSIIMKKVEDENVIPYLNNTLSNKNTSISGYLYKDMAIKVLVDTFGDYRLNLSKGLCIKYLDKDSRLLLIKFNDENSEGEIEVSLIK